jgi:hypothetical protein
VDSRDRPSYPRKQTHRNDTICAAHKKSWWVDASVKLTEQVLAPVTAYVTVVAERFGIVT